MSSSYEITEKPGTVPVKNNKFQRNFTCIYNTAKADLVIGDIRGKKVCSMIYIINTHEGNGSASKLLNHIEDYAIQCKCDELWCPTVLHPKLMRILTKRGFKLDQKIHERMGTQADVFVKRLSKK